MRRLLPALLTLLALAGCGGDSGNDSASTTEGPAARDARAELGKATDPAAVPFPSAEGKTLEDLSAEINVTGPQVGMATSVFVKGHNRLAFGVIDPKSGFVYGPTAVYVARKATDEAEGPFPAPADLLVTEPPFRSKQAATEKDPFAAVYAVPDLELDRTGRHNVLVVTQVNGRFVAAGTQIDVKAKSPTPRPGDKAPVVDTDTTRSARGNIESIDTRLPPSDMHDANLRDVIGKKPVVLVFATPQLCASRVCGPVVDIALQLKAKYGDQVEFIHQEVYVDNDPNKGLRKPLQAYGLPTEPWLFTIGKDGRVAAALEGSFGLDAFESAIKAALVR